MTSHTATALLTARGVVGGLLLGLASLVQADNKPTDVTVGEMALLPEYCPDTMGFNYGDASYNTSPRAPYWVGVMGPSFWAVHHHCWALIRVQRALAPGVKPEIREGLLRGAIADYQYVVAKSKPGFVLLPEVYLRIGEAFLLLGAPAAAQEAFAKSREEKPAYWPPYVRWADALAKLGVKDQARAHLEEGLRIMPDEPALIEAYRKLGGNPKAFVRALPRPAAPRASAASASAARN
jgi:tetratricopeptide (TPR) repeat protein